MLFQACSEADLRRWFQAFIRGKSSTSHINVLAACASSVPAPLPQANQPAFPVPLQPAYVQATHATAARACLKWRRRRRARCCAATAWRPTTPGSHQCPRLAREHATAYRLHTRPRSHRRRSPHSRRRPARPASDFRSRRLTRSSRRWSGFYLQKGSPMKLRTTPT